MYKPCIFLSSSGGEVNEKAKGTYKIGMHLTECNPNHNYLNILTNLIYVDVL